MADNILTADRTTTDIDLAAKDIAGVLYPRNILTDPSGTDITPLTDAALRATAVPVSGTVAVTGTFWQATQPVSIAAWSGLTDAELRADPVETVDTVPTVVIVSLQTNATGATYNAFASQACVMLDIVNTQPAAVDLEVRRGSSGNTIVVPAGSSRMFVGLSNASGIEVRRLDQSGTQITFTAEAIAQ